MAKNIVQTIHAGVGVLFNERSRGYEKDNNQENLDTIGILPLSVRNLLPNFLFCRSPLLSTKTLSLG